MATANPSYASTQNAVYNNSNSQFVDLATRLRDTIATLPAQAQRNWHSGLRKALTAFKRNHPNLKNFSNRLIFPLCRAIDIRLSEITIDCTMQRLPNLLWILNIITNFRAWQAQPIQVYKTSANGWGGWDGQHTALALYIIACDANGLGLSPDDVMVPVCQYDMNNRGQIRATFIANNTTTGKNKGKQPLDTIDVFMQKIYGVEIDGVSDPEWVTAHTKWKDIKAAGMFLTAEKFGNINQVGAISRLNELDEASESVVRQFSIYGRFIVATLQRPINTKEIPIIIEFFNLCEQNDIVYSDADIEDLAVHLIELFDANFDAKSPFWDQVHQATVNAWKKSNRINNIPAISQGPVPSNLKNTPQGTGFMWHQLQKTWLPTQKPGFPFPKQPSSNLTPDTTDLF